jgi:myxalamid-type polyketide synthase MxaE and MxaD
MRAASAEERATFASAGLLPMAADLALDALGTLLATHATQALIAAVDWNVLKPVYAARRPRPLFGEIATPEIAARHGSVAVEVEPWDLRGVDWESDWLLERIRAEVARVLGLGDAREVDVARQLFEMGLDSLMAVELRGRLEKRSRVRLPATLTFDFPSVTALAAFLGRQLSTEMEREEVSL